MTIRQPRGDSSVVPEARPVPLQRPVMRQRWEKVGFAHWAVDPDELQSRLPSGLTVDLHDGAAWVSLVAFDMVGIGPLRGPAVPYFGTFPETNVRTYVQGPDGTRGVWFDSLDATRLLPVLVARAAYGLPYMWSEMSIVESGRSIEYRATRRFPGAPGAVSRFRLDRSGPRVQSDELDRFLTARWNLFTARGRRRPRAVAADTPDAGGAR